jgi:hypothetical protein
MTLGETRAAAPVDSQQLMSERVEFKCSESAVHVALPLSCVGELRAPQSFRYLRHLSLPALVAAGCAPTASP